MNSSMTEPATLSERTEAPYQPFSASRIAAIATNTLTELTRQKVFYTLLVFALVIIASAGFFAQFTFEREDVSAGQIKFVKDFGLGAIAILGAVLAIVGTAQMLPAEIDNRTLYTILAKPVRRVEFLLGKYCGMLLLLLISVAVMSVLYFFTIEMKHRAVRQQVLAESLVEGMSQEVIDQEVAKLRADAHDPALIKAILLLYVKMALLSAMTLFFSTFSTSMIFSVVVTTCVYFIGHLEVTARESARQEQAGFVTNFFLTLVSWLVPNLRAFDVADDIVVGYAVPWKNVLFWGGYGLLYIAALFWFAHVIFSEKEI